MKRIVLVLCLVAAPAYPMMQETIYPRSVHLDVISPIALEKGLGNDIPSQSCFTRAKDVFFRNNNHILCAEISFVGGFALIIFTVMILTLNQSN